MHRIGLLRKIFIEIWQTMLCLPCGSSIYVCIVSHGQSSHAKFIISILKHLRYKSKQNRLLKARLYMPE